MVLFSDLGGLNENDIQLIEDKFSRLGIILEKVAFNKEYLNYFEDFSLQTFYVFSPSFLTGMLNDERGHGVWKSVKAIIAHTQIRLSGKEYVSEIKGTVTQRSIKFGIHIILDVNTSFNFDLSKIANYRLFNTSLDQILSFLVRQTPNEKYELPCYVRFSSERKEWTAETFEEYLLRKSKTN